MPFGAPLFANVYNAEFGANVPSGETQGDAGAGWAKATAAGAALVMAPAPSSTISVAEQAMAGQLAGWNSDNDNAGMLLKTALITFAASMVPGFLGPALVAVPPAGPPPIDSVFSMGDAGADALSMGNAFGGILASWFPTGTFIIPGAPPIGPLPWI